MKKLFRFFPACALASGVVGALSLSSLFGTANERGLLAENHPAHWLLFLLLGIVAAASVLYGCFGTKGDFRYLLKFPVQGVGFLAGAAACLYAMLLRAEETPLLYLIYGIAIACFLVLALCRFLKRKAPILIFAALNVVLTICCFWSFREGGMAPQLQTYLFPALAALFCALNSLAFAYLEVERRAYKPGYILLLLTLFSCLVCLSTPLWPYYLGMAIWALSGLFTASYAMRLPEDALRCIRKLEKAGYRAYAVGGCVRDTLLGLTPNDYDLCTDATPEQICQVFDGCQLVRNGEKHGTIGVVLHKTVYEITTFRTEGGYQDGRHPDWVEFVTQLPQDLARRDFTVNAIAFHPEEGYIDPFGGQEDLRNGILQAVGEPETRFREDALRILRAVRFASRFRLEVAPKTLQAMNSLAPLMDQLAKERIFAELNQTLCHMDATDMQTYRTVLLQVIPQLADTVDFDQHSRYHRYDVYTHTAHVLAATEPIPALRWAGLLHDIGKPQTFTQDPDGSGHFKGHAQLSAQMADTILRDLKAPNELREQVVFLIEHHMDDLEAKKPALRKKLSKYGEENLRYLIGMQWADAFGKGTSTDKVDRHYSKLLDLLAKLHAEEGRLQVTDLAINGHDLIDAGFQPGPALGACQKKLLELVLNSELANEKEALLEKAKELLGQENEA